MVWYWSRLLWSIFHMQITVENSYHLLTLEETIYMIQDLVSSSMLSVPMSFSKCNEIWPNCTLFLLKLLMCTSLNNDFLGVLPYVYQSFGPFSTLSFCTSIRNGKAHHKWKTKYIFFICNVIFRTLHLILWLVQISIKSNVVFITLLIILHDFFVNTLILWGYS